MKVTYVVILCLTFLSCGMEGNEREIDLQKSEELVSFMDQLSIDRLELRNDHLIVNDTLLYFRAAAVDSADSGWTAHQMEIGEWVEERDLDLASMTDLKRLMRSSNNLRVVKEKGAYFFNEGAWIDADWGKVFSLRDISSKQAEFSFDRVQEITAISDQPNWYVYYAD